MRSLLTAVGVSLTLIALAAFPCRYVPAGGVAGMVLSGAWPYLVGAALPAGVALLAARRWLLGAVAMGLAAGVVVAYAPIVVGRDEPAGSGGVTVRVVTMSLEQGWSDAEGVVRAARENGDIVAMQEVTRLLWRNMRGAWLDRAFPVSRVYPAPLSAGIGFWGRYPIVESWLLAGSYSMPALAVRVAVPGVTLPVTILVAHVANPFSFSFDAWNSDLSQLRTDLANVATRSGGGCVIAAGDFNSTMDAPGFRALLTGGYRDASEQVGSLPPPTFPAGLPAPPLFGIDHVLTRNCGALSVKSLVVPGSDHRGLAVTVHID